MIITRRDLLYYLKEDAIRNNSSNYFMYLAKVLIGVDSACAFRYIKCLRHCEFHYNNSETLYHKILYIYYKIKLYRLGHRYHIFIPLNVCGYGLRIIHLIGGVYLNAECIGNYCGFNSGTLIGNKDSQTNRPIIGDYTAFGPGAKAFGKIKIGSNVFVAPNAVVTKDVQDNSIVGGVPARLIKTVNT